MTSSYLKIKKLVADEDAAGFGGNEEEDEEEDDDAGEGERAVEVKFVKKKKFSSGEGSGAKVVGGGSPPCCLVENCVADLSGCKKYHQRHRVCEVHAKAPVVLVDGLRQRFCQQCSRFHELSEFDQSKRSCRRRLAGHNERRRRKSSLESLQEGSSSRRLKDGNKTGSGSLTMNPADTDRIGSLGNQNLHFL